MLQFDDEIKELTFDKIKTMLIQGRTSKKVNKTTSETFTYEINANGDEIPVGKSVTTKIDQSTVLESTPNWLLNAIIESLSIESAIKLLESNGYIVIDPSAQETRKEINKEISANTINVIKHKLLGIPLLQPTLEELD